MACKCPKILVFSGTFCKHHPIDTASDIKLIPFFSYSLYAYRKGAVVNIHKAKASDAEALKVLYFEHLTKFPPQEEQDMELWRKTLDKFEQDQNMYLLVLKVDNQVVASVQLAIIESLTHNVRPFAIVENVVTHADHRNRGYASALLAKATEIAKEKGCYKISLETGSNQESTLNFYRKMGLKLIKSILALNGFEILYFSSPIFRKIDTKL